MDRDTVIRLARQVWGQTAILPTAELERFAALVAAHEREECARLMEAKADGVWANTCAAAIRSKTNPVK